MLKKKNQYTKEIGLKLSKGGADVRGRTEETLGWYLILPFQSQISTWNCQK